MKFSPLLVYWSDCKI